MSTSPLRQSTKGRELAQIEVFTEAATFTNLAKQTLYALVSQRRVPHFKRGKRLLFRLSDLEQWLLESKRKTIQEIKADLRKG